MIAKWASKSFIWVLTQFPLSSLQEWDFSQVLPALENTSHTKQHETSNNR